MITVRTNSPARGRHWRTRSATALASIGALVLSSGLVLMAAPGATANGGEGGNNGTLKILNAISGEELRNNEPKVCAFKYEGFGFDEGQSGKLVVVSQPAGTFGPFTVLNVDPMGPDGYFISPVQYLQAGQYKVEFQDSTDSRKFKSKVFKSTCEEQPAPIQVTVTENDATCELGYGTREGTVTKEYVWTSGGWQLEPASGWTTAWGEWTYEPLSAADFVRLGCQPDQPDPVVVPLEDERMTCAAGVEAREGTQTTTYVWNAETRAYDPVVGPEVWGPWMFVRDLTDAEFDELGCRPDQPDPVVAPLEDEQQSCDNGVEQRVGTQTTTYVWNGATRTYDPVVGEELWGAWVTVRDLTAEESLELGCIAGEETVVPEPTTEARPETHGPRHRGSGPDAGRRRCFGSPGHGLPGQPCAHAADGRRWPAPAGGRWLARSRTASARSARALTDEVALNRGAAGRSGCGPPRFSD